MLVYGFPKEYTDILRTIFIDNNYVGYIYLILLVFFIFKYIKKGVNQ